MNKRFSFIFAMFVTFANIFALSASAADEDPDEGKLVTVDSITYVLCKQYHTAGVTIGENGLYKGDIYIPDYITYEGEKYTISVGSALTATGIFIPIPMRLSIRQR